MAFIVLFFTLKTAAKIEIITTGYSPAGAIFYLGGTVAWVRL